MAPTGVGEGDTGSFPDPTCKPASEFTGLEKHSARSCLLGGLFLLSGRNGRNPASFATGEKERPVKPSALCKSQLLTMKNIHPVRASDTGLLGACTFNRTHGRACPAESPLDTSW